MIRRSCTLAGSGAALTREAASAEFKRAEPAAGQRGNIRFNTSSLSIKWLLLGCSQQALLCSQLTTTNSQRYKRPMRA